jgi:hypothetical protein
MGAEPDIALRMKRLNGNCAMSKMSPMRRSLELMRGRGYHCEITEHRTHDGTTHDLFGFGDILCVHKEEGDVVVVQTTSRSNISARVKKITDSELLPIVRNAGFYITVHGWGYMARSKTFECKEVDLS